MAEVEPAAPVPAPAPEPAPRASETPKSEQPGAAGGEARASQQHAGMEGGGNRKSLLASIFNMAIYFPKFVMINNTRLTILYYILTLLLIMMIGFYFLVNSQYNIDKAPFMMVHMCNVNGTQCRVTIPELNSRINAAANQEYCTSPSNFQYWASPYKKWNPSGCARMCGTQTATNPLGTIQNPDFCLDPAMTMFTTPEMAFVTTYISQKLFTQTITTGCPSGFTITNGVCVKSVEKFVPGAENQVITFSHEFAVSPPVAAFSFSTKDKKSMQGNSGSDPWSSGMKTILYSYDGSEVQSWAAGSMVSLPVSTLLAAANYDDVGPSGNLNLDQVYSRIDYNVPDNTLPNAVNTGVSLRMSGVTVTIELTVTDSGKCYHILLEEYYNVDAGPVACMFVSAERTWTNLGTQYQMDPDGSYKELQRSGVRIKFRPHGYIGLFDMTTVMQTFTVAVVWIQIPLVIVYYFTVLCLGHLSSVYGRVLHQEVSLGNACKGLACRLVSHSASFMDLQDKSDGISKERLGQRFHKILDSRIKSGEIDDNEIDNYVNFVFEGMQAMGEEVVINDTISIQEFCEACCTNESLSFQDMVALFDKDRKVSCLENFFLDDTIRGVINEAKKDLGSKTAQLEHEENAREEKELSNSVLKMKVCSDQCEELEGVCAKIMKTASSELDMNKELAARAAAVAKVARAEGKNVIDPISDFTPTEDPKPDQRESACSVADEEDPGKM